ncbi:Transcription factor [Dirofilaria immitis]
MCTSVIYRLCLQNASIPNSLQMFAKITALLTLYMAVVAEEKSFLNLKKVIRGALDVVAAVPTSAPVNYNFANPSQVTAPNSIQGIDPIIRERLSRLFHIPPDFVHRLAAQAGFIDYEPTTPKPYRNYWLKPKPYVPQANPEYTTGSAFIQENPSIASNSANDLAEIVQQQSNFSNSSHIIINHTISEQQAAILQSEQQAVIFQPVIKDGHLYYQPFSILPQGSQPKMIIYDGRLYMATPFLSEIPAQQVIMGDTVTQNSSEVTDKKENDNQVSDIPNQRNEEIHYHRIYEKHIKAAEDEQARTTKLQQIIVPDASLIEIHGVESKAKISSPYRKVYKEELENYDIPHQFNLKKRLQKINDNLAQKEREAINFQMTKSVTSHDRPVETAANFAGKTNNSNLESHQLSLNEDFKNYERIDNKSIDRAAKEQTTTSTQQTDKFIIGTFSREKVEEDENSKFADATQSMRRILALRRKMAADRKKFARRKRLLLSMKRKVNKEDSEREV